MNLEQKQRTQDLPPTPTDDLHPLSLSEKYGGRTYLAATCGQNRVAALFSKKRAARRICCPGKCGQDLRREKNNNRELKSAQKFQKIKPQSNHSRSSENKCPKEDWKD